MGSIDSIDPIDRVAYGCLSKKSQHWQQYARVEFYKFVNLNHLTTCQLIFFLVYGKIMLECFIHDFLITLHHIATLYYYLLLIT